MAATKPAFTPPGKKGDMIFSALVKLAALIVLLMLGGIIVSLIISSPSIQKFGFAFCGPKSGMRLTRSSARWSRFTEPGHLFYRAADRRSGELRHRAVSDRIVPARLKRPLGIAIELLAAIPSIVYGMWGLFIFAPLFATYFRAGRQRPVDHPVRRRAVCRPGFWYRYSRRWRHSGHHDHPLHRRGHARCFRADPVMMKESAYGIGCTTGGDLAHRFTVH